MSPKDILLPTYVQMLRALSAWLEKAAAQTDDSERLPAARLAPDMFPLSTQVRFSCAQVYEGVCRLQGTDFPPVWRDLIEEGRHGGERPGGLANARARIEETLAFLESVDPETLNADDDQQIVHELPNGMTFDMTVGQYARDWSLSQFYFHVMAAYAILRQSGVGLGKKDYVAHMFAYVRPGTMPGG
ncbi:MAG: DUF1993 family protein [Parvularculaceae bacterium]